MTICSGGRCEDLSPETLHSLMASTSAHAVAVETHDQGPPLTVSHCSDIYSQSRWENLYTAGATAAAAGAAAQANAVAPE